MWEGAWSFPALGTLLSLNLHMFTNMEVSEPLPCALDFYGGFIT